MLTTGNWDRLAATPRPLTEELQKIRGKPFGFLRKAVKKWEHEITNAPLVFAAVVQANSALFDAKTSQWAPAVLLYTTDPALARDGAWLRQVADRAFALKEHRTGDRREDALGALLADEDSTINIEVPPTLTGGVPARIVSTFVDPARLPGRAIPEHRLLVGLAFEGEVVLLPSTYY
jgi:hypothetical protein